MCDRVDTLDVGASVIVLGEHVLPAAAVEVSGAFSDDLVASGCAVVRVALDEERLARRGSTIVGVVRALRTRPAMRYCPMLVVADGPVFGGHSVWMAAVSLDVCDYDGAPHLVLTTGPEHLYGAAALVSSVRAGEGDAEREATVHAKAYQMLRGVATGTMTIRRIPSASGGPDKWFASGFGGEAVGDDLDDLLRWWVLPAPPTGGVVGPDVEADAGEVAG